MRLSVNAQLDSGYFLKSLNLRFSEQVAVKSDPQRTFFRELGEETRERLCLGANLEQDLVNFILDRNLVSRVCDKQAFLRLWADQRVAAGTCEASKLAQMVLRWPQSVRHKSIVLWNDIPVQTLA